MKKFVKRIKKLNIDEDVEKFIVKMVCEYGYPKPTNKMILNFNNRFLMGKNLSCLFDFSTSNEKWALINWSNLTPRKS